MQSYERFIFDSYRFDRSRRTIELTYALDDAIRFTETLTLPTDADISVRDEAALDRALFALHLIGGISYYKTCLPPSIEIRSGSLTEEQAEFWNSVYEHGLGEFFYRNGIDGRGRISFPVDHSIPTQSLKLDARSSVPAHLLVPIGGGKDSAVTIELLKKSGKQITLFRAGGHPFIDRFAETADRPLLTVGRALSPTLFKLNAEGALNGHVPVTGYLSFLTVALAEIFDFTHVVFSNERSADEGNVEVDGMIVNHQWSKSLEFERMLRGYLRRFVTGNTEFFSLLRPLSELHIMQLFSEYPKYFDVFTSCNKNWKIQKATNDEREAVDKSEKTQSPKSMWCGSCPKCAFAFALLSAFVPKERVTSIFGKDIFADASMLPLFRQLLGLEGIKPFDCVGTPRETAAALLLADENGEWDDSPVMTMFRKEALDRFPHADALVTSLLTPSSGHEIPGELRSSLPV